jgi:hypothetical protein
MSTAQQLQTVEERREVTAQQRAVTPLDMLNAALERGDAVDKMEKLMDLHERWEKAQARKAFFEAKAKFKANAPTVVKDAENKQYNSAYATIGNVVNTINAVLGQYDLDASWDIKQPENADGIIIVICTLTHPAGHSVSVEMKSAPDKSGNKNPIQQIKSATTYMKLATFEAVTGIATKEGNKDDDGNSAGVAPINDVQVKTINDLLDDTASDLEQFKKHFGISDVKELPARRFQEAMNIFAAKRKLKNG